MEAMMVVQYIGVSGLSFSLRTSFVIRSSLSKNFLRLFPQPSDLKLLSVSSSGTTKSKRNSQMCFAA